MARKHLVVASTLVVVILIAGWFIFKPGHRHESPPLGMSAAVQVDPGALRAIRTSVPFVETKATLAESREALVPVFERAALRDEIADSIVTAAARKMLAEQVGAHVAARSSENIDDFVNMVLSNSPRWVSPKHPRAWKIATDFAGKDKEDMIDAADPQGSLRALSEAVLQGNLRLIAVGADTGGSLIKFGRVRTREGLENELWLGDIMNAYWNAGPTTAPIRLWDPPISLEEILRRDKSAAVARVCFLARTEMNETAKIISTWYFDPRAGRWHCDSMYNRGRAFYAVVF